MINGTTAIVVELSPLDIKENLENVAYNMKEINAFYACHSYIVAAICSSDDHLQAQQILKRAFGHTELMNCLS